MSKRKANWTAAKSWTKEQRKNLDYSAHRRG